MTGLDPEDLALFLSEAEEVLENLEEGVITLERQGESPAILAELFRAAHTLKGSSATAGFSHLARVTHHLESVLAMARDGECHLDAGTVDVLLDTVDWLRQATSAIRRNAPDLDSGALVAGLESLVRLLGDPASSVTSRCAVHSPASSEDSAAAGETAHRGNPAEAPATRPVDIEASFSEDADMPGVRMYQALVRLESTGRLIESRPSIEDIEQGRITQPFRVSIETQMSVSELESLVQGVPGVAGVKVTDHRQREMPLAEPDGDVPGAAQRADGSSSGRLGQTVRVNVSIIDSLMNLVGELIIDRTRLAGLIGSLERPGDEEALSSLNATAAHLGRMVSEVQDSIMRARLMPLQTLFKKYPRMVRDLARKSNKQIEFEISGEDTELDRSVIEALDDPLIHLLRNCVDHGIEPPAERLEKDKPAHGRVSVSARHQESCVVVTVSDDGRGIDPSKMRSVAASKALLQEDEASRLTDEQAIDLIFMPGFTTATKVDETSGRGVGLDVVRANLKRINGSLDLWTRPGEGTRFTMRLPLTLAVVRALLVSAAGDVYAVPASAIQEVVPLEPGAVRTVAGREVIIVREGTYPLMRLARLLRDGVAGCVSSDQAQMDECGNEGNQEHFPCRYAVVISTAGPTVAFGVEQILNEQEIVVRSLGGLLKSTPGISGATILGNGEIALILDAHALVLGLDKRVL